MRQCKLQKGKKECTAWIDVRPTDQGKFTSLKTSEGYDTGWRIITVGDKDFSKEWISARSQDHKNMKKMTDV